jgi:hypothetical protein
MADVFSDIGKGISDVFSGLTGGKGSRSSSPVEGEPNEMRKKQLEMDAVQRGQMPSASSTPTNANSEQEVNDLRAKAIFNSPNVTSGRGMISGMKKGGSVSSASSRADGIAQRGKTRGTMIMCGGGMARGKK